jgi:hypothetical protein
MRRLRSFSDPSSFTVSKSSLVDIFTSLTGAHQRFETQNIDKPNEFLRQLNFRHASRSLTLVQCLGNTRFVWGKGRAGAPNERYSALLLAFTAAAST